MSLWRARIQTRYLKIRIFRALLLLLLPATLIGCNDKASTRETNAPDVPVNSAPIISGDPAQDVVAGELYQFTPTSSDADGDELVFSGLNLPSWVALDTTNGTLSGTPVADDVGLYTDIQIEVSDGSTSASLDKFSIEVKSATLPNTPPLISGTAPGTATVNLPYSFVPDATDADNDTLTFEVINLPGWADLNVETGELSGTPQPGDEGEYTEIQILVSDGTDISAAAPFTITVVPEERPNTRPEITGTPPAAVLVGNAYDFTPSATDADGDPLTFAILNLPPWAQFDQTTGRLFGTPQTDHVGSHTDIGISVSDGTSSASLPSFSIEVTEPPPPARAFPGAEGFGADSKGGRGGNVYRVSTLADSGPGSLRWAIDQSGPRTVVFAVSGIIELSSQLSIDNPFITIAGQTSPSGVTIKGGRIKIRTHDVIIRGLRIRPGDGLGGMTPENRDGLSIGHDDGSVYNVIVDHSSFTWAVDENGSNWLTSDRVTIQWCIFAEGLRNSIHPEGPHSMGYLVGAGTQRLTLHHNLFASNEHRNPVIANAQSIEVINNAGYNWVSEGLAVGSSGATTLHGINNVYIHGPNTTVRPAFYLRFDEFSQHRIYLKGNVDSKYRPSASSGDEWDVAHGYDPAMRSQGLVFEPSGVTTEAADSALSRVLNAAGAITPARDSIDARIISTVVSNSGAIIDSPGQVGGYQTPAATNPPVDSDEDGMPDTWELSRGLDPADGSDGIDDRNGDGYTELEEYLNSFFN